MTGRGVRAVYGDQVVADFRVALSLLLQITCHQCAIRAYPAARRMLILKASVQALVSVREIAIAETGQLRESLWDLLRHLISPLHISGEIFRRQRRIQAGQWRSLGEMGRDPDL